MGAIEEIRKLLIPANDGEDGLKKKQLMELAIINGTYRDNGSKGGVKQNSNKNNNNNNNSSSNNNNNSTSNNQHQINNNSNNHGRNHNFQAQNNQFSNNNNNNNNSYHGNNQIQHHNNNNHHNNHNNNQHIIANNFHAGQPMSIFTGQFVPLINAQQNSLNAGAQPFSPKNNENNGQSWKNGLGGNVAPATLGNGGNGNNNND